MEASVVSEVTRASKGPLPRRPLRVLHVVDSLNCDAVGRWVVQLLYAFDPRTVQMDFSVVDESLGVLANEASARGAEIHRCPKAPAAQWRYQFGETLYNHGPFDAVHIHLGEASGPFLEAAARAGVAMRILHAHEVPNPLAASRALRTRFHRWRRRRRLLRYATLALATCEAAAEAAFGPNTVERNLCEIVPTAVDLTPFMTAYGDQDARFEFGFTAAHHVIGHAGRFDEANNHRFLLDVAETVIRWRPQARFLFVGDGPLRREIEDDCERRGLNNFVVFAGGRSDVARLMTGVMDAFAYPLAWTGLPISFVEAQAAGLPAVVSTEVPESMIFSEDLVRRLTCGAGASRWAEALLETMHSGARVHRNETIRALASSSFSIERNAAALESLYREGRGRPLTARQQSAAS